MLYVIGYMIFAFCYQLVILGVFLLCGYLFYRGIKALGNRESSLRKRMLSGWSQILLLLCFLGIFLYVVYRISIYSPVGCTYSTTKSLMGTWCTIMERYAKENGTCLKPEKHPGGYETLPSFATTFSYPDLTNYLDVHDDFSKERKSWFRYNLSLNEKDTTILIYSCGPDKFYDLDTAGLNPLSSETEFWKFEYDPSNGTYSKGDIYYVWKFHELD